MHDIQGGESWVDAAMYLNGISDEQLIQILCIQLNAKISATSIVEWRPKIDKLEKEEKKCDLVLKFLILLRIL